MTSPEVESNAWKAQDKGPSIEAVTWTMTVLGTVFVAARLYVRGIIWKRLRADDYYVTCALVRHSCHCMSPNPFMSDLTDNDGSRAFQTCGYISTALSTLAVNSGNGKHFTFLSTSQQEKTILYTIAAFMPGVLSFGLPKMAVITLLTRLLNPSKKHRWFLWWMGYWCMLTLFATCGVLIGQCYPARSLWDFSVEGSCMPKSVLIAYCQYAGGMFGIDRTLENGKQQLTKLRDTAFSAFVDLYLAVYPTCVLYKLQMNAKKKLALCFALGLGLA